MCKKYFSFFILLTLLSCFKDESSTTTTIIKNDPRHIISASKLVIEVADENDDKIVGLTASFNDEIKVVDKASYFHFNCQNVNKYEELLQITDKEGYVYDYLLPLQANEVNYKKINVFIKKKSERFTSTEDFTLSISPRISIFLNKNNFLVNVNQNYTGSIDTRHNHYDINNENHFRSLPGGRFGVKDNQLWLLNIEDAFEFNLYSADKQNLGFKNQVTIQIPEVKSGSALYYYDPASHVWSYQEDVVSNQKTKMTHTGTYCIAQSKNYSVLKGRWLINQTAAKKSIIELSSSTFKEQVLTSNNGTFEAIVSENEEIEVRFQTGCEPISLEKVTPVGRDFDMGTKSSISTQVSNYKFTGQMKDCDGNLIKEGFLKIRTQNLLKTIFIDSSHFAMTVPMCTNDLVSVSCVSVTGENETTIITNVPNEIDLSSLFLCSELKNDYVVLNMEGSQRKYTSFKKSINNTSIQIGENGFNEPFYLKFEHSNTSGKIENSKTNIVWNDTQIAGYGLMLNCPTSSNCGFTDVEITYLASDRSIIKGKFVGRFWLKTINPVGATYKDISGEFQLKQ